MKGQEGVILAILFMIILVGIGASIMVLWVGEAKKTEVESDIGLYTTNLALKFAKLYTETSLDYSVYQAMYDLGKRGGGDGTKCELTKDNKEFENNFKAEILKDLNAYTGGLNQIYYFKGKEVTLPTFSADKLNIMDSPSGMSVSLEGDRNIFLKEASKKQLGSESIAIEISSKMEEIYVFKFFALHEKAIDVSDRIKDCKTTLNAKEGDYEIVVSSDSATEPCTVTANVTDTSKKFPLFNGTSTSFEPISMVFSVNFGRTCQKQAGNWKITLLGDSLTSGYSQYLVGKSVCPNVLSGNALAGRTTSEMLNIIVNDKDIDKNGKYNTIVVMGGINDISGGKDSNEVIGNLQKMNDEAKKKGVRIIYMTILPWKGYASWNAGMQIYTDNVNTWLKNSGYDVIDAYEKMEEGDTDALISNYDGGDHLHLNPQGYEVLAEYVATEMQTRWSLCKSSTTSGGTTSGGTTPSGGSTTPSSLTLAGKTIVLDPGHGGGDPGANDSTGTETIFEKNVNLQIARMIGAEMTNRGARVIYTRNDDSNPDLAARTAIANNNQADIFISVHANANVGCTGRGTETYVYCLCNYNIYECNIDDCNSTSTNEKNLMFQSDRQLAQDIQPLLATTLGTADRGIKGGNLGVLRDARMPAVLIETAFICNVQEANLLNDPTQQGRIGEAITDSLENFYAP